ncbi:hypothetical protein BN1088_1432694 [Sphingobacterium sp. PM2-P1-29]|nr:hypothetical protein BN1088_1432694 [Sphingobacterium sp. PM2-P1-29]
MLVLLVSISLLLDKFRRNGRAYLIDNLDDVSILMINELFFKLL